MYQVMEFSGIFSIIRIFHFQYFGVVDHSGFGQVGLVAQNPFFFNKSGLFWCWFHVYDYFYAAVFAPFLMPTNANCAR